MKFKSIFFLFNFIILVSFGFVFFMPLPVLGLESSLAFWIQNWYIGILFIAVLGLLDGYFLVNWKLFAALEREDWPGLQNLLEAELEKKGVINLQKTRIYINSSLIQGKPQKINELRKRYLERKVAFLPSVALSLGLPLILEGAADEIEGFFQPLLGNRKAGADAPWLRWGLAFGLMLKQRWQEAKELLFQTAVLTKQPLLQLLSLYLLDNLRDRDADVRKLVDATTPSLKARLTDKEWELHVDGLKERVILVLFMSKLIGEARTWLAGFQLPGADFSSTGH